MGKSSKLTISKHQMILSSLIFLFLGFRLDAADFKSKLIKDIGYQGNLYITLHDHDGNEKNVEEVHFMSTKFMDLASDSEYYGWDLELSEEAINRGIKTGQLMSSPVKGIYNYTFKIMGDDGKDIGTLTGTQVMTENSLSFSKPEIIDYINDFLSSDINNTKIEIKNVYGTLLPHETIGLCRLTEDFSWTYERREPNTAITETLNAGKYNWGTLIGTKEFSTTAGNYCFYFYSNDNDDKDIENILLYRDNEPFRCRVDGLTEAIMTHTTHDEHKADEFSIGFINLSYPKLGSFLIFDNELYNFIFKIAEDFNLGKSLFIKNNKTEFSFTEIGDINLMKTVEHKAVKEAH